MEQYTLKSLNGLALLRDDSETKKRRKKREPVPTACKLTDRYRLPSINMSKPLNAPQITVNSWVFKNIVLYSVEFF